MERSGSKRKSAKSSLGKLVRNAMNHLSRQPSDPEPVLHARILISPVDKSPWWGRWRPARQAEQLDRLADLTNELVIRGVMYGVFRAELPLAEVPRGELTVSLRGGKAVLATRPMGTASPPVPYGYARLPDLLDAVEFYLEPDDNELLVVRAMTKGIGNIRGSDALAAVSSSRFRKHCLE